MSRICLSSRPRRQTGSGPSLISRPAPPSTEPPPPPTEFRERLDAAGAKTGDIQISLIWFNTNDLDLHCIDPSGFEICWRPGQRRSPSGGELDVDRNAGCNRLTVEPVENIYWAPGTAKMGRYRVYLDFYQRCSGAPNETTYKINVLHNGERKEFSGTIQKDGAGSGPMRLIYEFQLEPKLELFVPTEFTIAPGSLQPLKLPFAIRREFYQDKIEVKAENLPAHVTAEPITLEPTQSEGELLLKAGDAAVHGKSRIKIVAIGNGVRTSADPEMTVALPAAGFSLANILAIGVWTALLAVGLCLALLAGQNYYLGKPLFAPGSIPLTMVILGAVAAGFVSGTIGQILYSLFLMASGSLGFIGRLFGWTLLGGLLGSGASFFVANLDRKKAALAGLCGGFLGALAFEILSYVLDVFGRFGGAAMLGFCIGLMVAMVEAAFRRAWLEVRFSEREAITVNLGPEPVKVGGDARACTVWARAAEPIALRYWIRDGKVHCEDVPAKRELPVADGDSRSAGNVVVVVRTASAPAGSPPAVAPLRPHPSTPSPQGERAPVVQGMNPPRAPAASPPVPVPPPPPAAVFPPQPAPPVPAPAKPAQPSWDDAMPLPVGPPPPARPAATSILDIDDMGGASRAAADRTRAASETARACGEATCVARACGEATAPPTNPPAPRQRCRRHLPCRNRRHPPRKHPRRRCRRRPPCRNRRRPPCRNRRCLSRKHPRRRCPRAARTPVNPTRVPRAAASRPAMSARYCMVCDRTF